MKRIYTALAVLLLLKGATPLSAQETAEQQVLAVINKMFDGMRAKDTTMIRSTLLDDVKLVSAVTSREGKPVVRSEGMDAFMKAVGSAEGKLDEKLFDPEVRIDDNLATVWVKYEFWFNDAYSHCGFDAFQLARTETGWKIFSIADTRRRECKK